MCRKMFSQTRIKWPDEEIHTDETFSQWMESIDWREAAYKDLGGWDKEWLNTSRNQPDVTGRWEGKGWIPKSRRLGVVEWLTFDRQEGVILLLAPAPRWSHHPRWRHMTFTSLNKISDSTQRHRLKPGFWARAIKNPLTNPRFHWNRCDALLSQACTYCAKKNSWYYCSGQVKWCLKKYIVLSSKTKTKTRPKIGRI